MDNTYLDAVLAQYGHRVFSKWNAPEGTVYIGRGSMYGNPFPMNDKSEQERERVCLAYREWLAQKIKDDQRFRNAVKNLHDKMWHVFVPTEKHRDKPEQNGVTDIFCWHALTT